MAGSEPERVTATVSAETPVMTGYGQVCKGLPAPENKDSDTVIKEPPVEAPTDADAGRHKAWVVMAASGLFEVSVPSLIYCWGILITCWNRTDLSLPLRTDGQIWTPILFSASWSVAVPWSDTLCVVHGHPRISSFVGAIMLSGGLMCTGLGSLFTQHSYLHAVLNGISSGICAGVGSSLISCSTRFVLCQRWGADAAFALSVLRFCRGLGWCSAPQITLWLYHSSGSAGTLLILAGLSLHAILIPLALRSPPQLRPRKYRRLQERHEPPTLPDFEAHTETSEDEGGSQVPKTIPHTSHASAGTDASSAAGDQRGVTILAEVYYDGSGEAQPQRPTMHNGGTVTPSTAVKPLTLSPSATARLANLHSPPQDSPRPLYGGGNQDWNTAYSFDCEGDEDIDLYVKKFPVKQGRMANFCFGLTAFLRSCRADFRPLIIPAFHLSLVTAVCCRLTALALAVLLPALAWARFEQNQFYEGTSIAALSSSAGLGSLSFAAVLAWPMVVSFDTSFSKKIKLSMLAAATAASFFVLMYANHSIWLLLGSGLAGFGTSGMIWAQGDAAKDALGGATLLRAKPLLSVLTGIATLLVPLFCPPLKLNLYFAILGGSNAILSFLWILQPYLAPRCW